ncbi:MAG: beta-ketoacyl synthase N-terminal-like domain-containing protein [Planctomycetota bacterium]
MAYLYGWGGLTGGGCGREELVAALAGGESAVRPHPALGIVCAAVDPDFHLADYTPTTYHYLDPAAAFTIAAVRMALDDAGITVTPETALRSGMTLGTRWGCTDAMAKYQAKLLDADPKFAPPFLFTNAFPNAPAAVAAIEFGLKGYNTVFAGCTDAGVLAVRAAVRAVDCGAADLVAAVGVDALSPVVADAWTGAVPPGEGAVCLLVGTVPRPGAVRMTPLAGGDADGAAAVFAVTGGVVRDGRGGVVPLGDMMAAGLPLALALAADKVRLEGLRKARVAYRDDRTAWTCLLEAV